MFDQLDDFEEQGLPILKSTLEFISSIGVGKIVGSSINTLAPQTTIFGKVTVFVAKMGISSAIAVASTNAMNAELDNAMLILRKFKNAWTKTEPESY